MIFSEVKNMTISQGDVKKINLTDGIILYEYAEPLVCEPVVGMTLLRGTNSYGNPIIKATSILSGISNSLITKWGIVYITKSKLGSKTLTIGTIGRTMLSVSSTDLDTVNGAEKTFSSTTLATTSMIYVFRSFVTYTNLNGSTVTAYSDQVEASYNSLS